MMRNFSKKDPSETITLTFDYSNDLIIGETLTGTPTVSIALYYGVSDPGISAMLSGSPIIFGSYVLQSCTAGLIGYQYNIKATCSTSTGRVLSIGGILPIVDAALQ